MVKDEFDSTVLEQATDAYFEHLKGFKEAKFRLGLRGSLTVIAIVIGSYFVFISAPEVRYWAMRGEEPTQLGDLRSPDFDKKALDSLHTNDYVSFKNDVVMFDELASEELNFYYSPLTRFVIATPQELPDKDRFRLRSTVLELGELETQLVLERVAFPEDVMVTFDGEGRYYRNEDVPKWAPPILSFMANSARVPVESLSLLVDASTPNSDSFQWFFVMFLVAIIVVLATLGFFIDAVVRYSRARKRLRDVVSFRQ